MSHTRKLVRKSSTDEVESGPRVSSSSDSDSEKTPPKKMGLRTSASVPLLSESDDEGTTLQMTQEEKATPANSTPTSPIKQPEIEAVEDTKTTLTQTHAAPEATAQAETQDKPTAQPDIYNTVPSKKAKRSPFEKLNNTLSHDAFNRKNFRGEPNINEAIFFCDVLKTIQKHAENPENAVNAVNAMVLAKEADHLEVSDMPPGNFYRDMACLKTLTPETIISEFRDYIDAVQQNAPTSDFQCYLKTQFLKAEGNIFAKLHLYLQINEFGDDKNHERKLSDFVSVLRVKLPAPQHNDSDDDFAPNGTVETDAAYNDAVLAITKKYTEKRLGLFSTYTGDFKKLIVELRNTKAPDRINQHKAYLELLAQIPENTSHFVNVVRKEMDEQKAKSGEDFVNQHTSSKRNSQ